MINLDRKKEIKKEIEDVTKLTKSFSLARFGIVILVIIFIVCFITLDQFGLYLGLSLGGIIVLLLVIVFTNPYYHRLKILKNLESIYQKHENRRALSYRSFTFDGREFVDYNDYKVLDLDILGPRSLYQYLCQAKTKGGRAKLAKQLTMPVAKPKEFTNCVKTLAEDENSLTLEASIAALSSDARDCDEEELLGLVKKKIKISSLAILVMIVSVLAFLAVLLCTLWIDAMAPYYLIFFIPLNFILCRRMLRNEVFSFPSTKYANLLEGYVRLAKDVLKITIHDPYYQNLQQTLNEELPHIIAFYKMFEMLSYRQNLLLSLIGNGTFFMDLWIAIRYNYQSKHLSSIEKGIDALTELELLLSLATIGMDNQVYTIPTLKDKIEILEGYHPLVKNCVPNSLTLEGGIVLTGSNMSGKTTFMRMLGVNQILANAGGLVCASSFQTSNFKVFTSLRANDMLQEGISTFYAEVNRMKKIVTESEQGNVLVLIDEIFKGTNAKDRIYAAKEIIKKLHSYQTNFLITTHDFELCEVPIIENYHFDEEYEENKIWFDYKIKKGKCQKTNAIYLLKLAGVLDTPE